jgi:hypothetical protein
MIDRQRILSEFLDLVQIDSLSRREGRIATRLAATLEGMGVRVEVAGTGHPRPRPARGPDTFTTSQLSATATITSASSRR